MRKLAVLFSFFSASLYAASEYPPGLQWSTITTPHFYVHYHQGEEELARRAAAIAEGVNDQLPRLLNWTPRERTHLILADHVDFSNGSATEFPNNRIDVYVSAPGADPSSPIGFYDDWLNNVVTHEYTHILHLDQARAFPAAIRRVFGRVPLVAFPNELSPLWELEGLAVEMESELTEAGRLKGTYVDMILRTAAAENRFATEAQASGIGPYWPRGNTRYYYGSKFLSWLVRKHGMNKLTEFVNDYSGNFLPFRVNATAQDVYGKSLRSLWREWSDEQQQTYRAEVEKLKADGLTERKKLTRLGYETQYGLLSPDGTRIAVAHAGPFERPTIRVLDAATGRELATHPVNSPAPLSWSADGKSIAYSDVETYHTFAILSDLYVWEVGGRTRRITSGARLRDPSFTPDGSLIAIRNGAGRNAIVEVNAATGAVRAIAEPPTSTQFSEPAVSHDGARIAVAEWHTGGQTDIVLYDRAGKRLANLTERFAHALNGSPRWSPDDRTIWFSSDVTGIHNLYAVPADGGEIKRLTNVYSAALYPTSRDGRTFFYSDLSSDGFDLATFDATRGYTIVPRTIPQSVAATPANRATSVDSGAASTPYSPWRSVRPRWWLPVLGATSNEDAIFGFTTAGGDVLGRHTYTATITNESHSIVYSYDRFYPTFTLAASRYDDDVATFVHGFQRTTYTETTDRVLAEVTVPYRRLQWQTSGTAGLIRDRIDGDIPTGLTPDILRNAGIFRGTLQGFRLGATFNNAHEYAFSISPEHGITALAQYENVRGEGRSLQQMRADARGYLSIPWSRSPAGRHVLAVRAAGGRNSGDFVLQRELKVGGIESDLFNDLDTTHFSVRGYDTGTLRGQSVAVASVEYRLPIHEIDRGPATWPLYFHRVHADVFLDAGKAWEQRAFAGNTIASTGAEVSFDVSFGYVLPVRFRAGVAWRLRDPQKGKAEPYVTVGSSF